MVRLGAVLLLIAAVSMDVPALSSPVVIDSSLDG
jgi:hypothetical protein